MAVSRRDPALIRANGMPNTGSYKLFQQISAQLDRPEEALADLRRTFKDQRTGNTSAWGIWPGIWAAYLGDPRLALEFIRPVAMDATYSRIVWAPFFRDMRRLPEFKTLVMDLKLVDFWRTPEAAVVMKANGIEPAAP
jgi:hypothetical protein